MISTNRFSFLREGLRSVFLPVLVLGCVLGGHLYAHMQPESKEVLVYRKVLAFSAVWAVAWIVGRFVGVAYRSDWLSSRLSAHFRPMVFLFLRIFVYVIAFLIALDTLGVSITPLVASLGVGSIAVGLALQDTLGNLFSGFYLYLDRPIAVGDWIQLESGVEGQVVRIGWRSTHLLVGGINHLVLPNSKMSSSMVTNFNLPHPEISVVVALGVGYSTSLERAIESFREAAAKVVAETPGGVTEFPPIVRLVKFGESSLDFVVIVRVHRYEDKFEAQHRLILALKSVCDREGIEIPFPQRVLHTSAAPTRD